MFDKKNDYALNIAEKNAIVYQDAFGELTRITPDQLSGKKEFRKWKNWIKMKTHTAEKKEHIHRNHSVSLSGLEEVLCGENGTDVSYEDRETLQREQMVALEKVRMIKMLLTEKQFRRLWLYAVEKKTLAQIAEQEGATISSVQESIDRAKKRCRKFFKTP